MIYCVFITCLIYTLQLPVALCSPAESKSPGRLCFKTNYIIRDNYGVNCIDIVTAALIRNKVQEDARFTNGNIGTDLYTNHLKDETLAHAHTNQLNGDARSASSEISGIDTYLLTHKRLNEERKRLNDIDQYDNEVKDGELNDKRDNAETRRDNCYREFGHRNTDLLKQCLWGVIASE